MPDVVRMAVVGRNARPVLETGAAGTEEAILPRLRPGQTVAVKYQDDPLWHERLLIGTSAEDLGTQPGWCWRIATPDGDKYEEALDGSQPGPHRMAMLGLDGAAPRLLRGKFYRFTVHPIDAQPVKKAVEHFKAQAHAGTPQPLPGDYVDSDGQVAPLPAEAMRDMSAVVAARGGAVPVGDAGQGRAFGRTPPGCHWIAYGFEGPDPPGTVVEPVDGIDVPAGRSTMLKQYPEDLYVKCLLVKRSEVDERVNERYDLASPGPKRADDGVGGARDGGTDTPREGEAAPGGDVCRTLWVDLDPRGERFKEWRQACLESRTERWNDGPIEGPASLLHWMNQTARNGGNPRLRLTEFCRDRRIEKSDGVFRELQNLAEA